MALAALAFGPQPTRAAVTEAWTYRFSNVLSNSVDRPLKVVHDAAGDIIVTGTSNDNTSGPDMLTIKYSGADGSMLWQRRQRFYSTPPDYPDYPGRVAVALAVDSSGNVAVTGSIENTDNNSESDYYTAKYAAATGSVLWEKRYHGRGDDFWTKAVAVDGSGNVVVMGWTATLKYAAADGTLLWVTQPSYPDNTFNAALTVDDNGNVVVTGSFYNATNHDYYTVKYAAADGALLWEKHYNSPANGEDRPSAVALDASDNVVVTGSSDGDFYTVKYAATDGALLWDKRYNGPTNTSDFTSESYDYASAVAADGSGNVVVTGESDSDFYTAKYAAADGALLWEKRYNGPVTNFSKDVAPALALDGSGNVVVTGVSSSSEQSQGWFPFSDYYTAKYAAADGALIWENRYDSHALFYPGYGFTDSAAAVVDGSGNVIVTGASFSDAGGRWPFDSDYLTVKYAAGNGALLWENRYNGPAHYDSHPNAVAMDRSGNVVVTATSESDFYTAKYAASNGALLWEKRGAGASSQVAVDGNGNVVVAGYAYAMTNGGNDYYTVKYAADGALLWEKSYNGQNNSEDYALAVVLDASGNVVVTGSSASDYYTAKYAAPDGALLWEKSYNGPANGEDHASAVAVDASGNVVVTGTSYNAQSNGDYFTAKYASATGALLWEKRYNGQANGEDYASAVAVDASGNVVVTGQSSIGTGRADFYTAKYATSDGALLWEQRYNGPTNGVDYHSQASAVAVDASGNVVVTGSSNIGTNYDYYTAKYATADGDLLWEQRYNGPANSQDRAEALSLDGSGNVVVTGTSYNDKSDGDYYTAKYAAADGALLWEKRHNSPPNGHEGMVGSHSLALGPNGLVAITGSSNLETTGSDVFTVVYREALPPLSIELVPTGVRLRFTGTPGRGYTIERASAVTGPWNSINTQTAPTSGLIEFNDSNPPLDVAFYRIVQP